MPPTPPLTLLVLSQVFLEGEFKLHDAGTFDTVYTRAGLDKDPGNLQEKVPSTCMLVVCT